MTEVTPRLEELLALDLLTLRDHTELAGDRLDADTHARTLGESMAMCQVCSVRRDGALVAYAMLHRLEGDAWFVRAFNTHPAHRSAPVMQALMRQVGEVANREGIRELRSHVYRTNRRSLAFHRRLGFRVGRENDKAVEFIATMDDLASRRALVERRPSRAERPSR